MGDAGPARGESPLRDVAAGAGTSFEALAGLSGVAVGVGGLAYSIAFVTYLKAGSTAAAKLSSLLLMLGGVLALPVLVAIYERVRHTDAGIALVALVLGVLGSAGTAIHGAYDLANFIKPPGVHTGNLPNATDPRGVATFAFSGMAILLVSWLIVRGGTFPRRLGYLGYLAGALLIYVYLGRLIILNPKSPGVLPFAVLSGFLVNPAWVIWAGAVLWRGGQSPGD
jgi:hypothetical protein